MQSGGSGSKPFPFCVAAYLRDSHHVIGVLLQYCLKFVIICFVMIIVAVFGCDKNI